MNSLHGKGAFPPGHSIQFNSSSFMNFECTPSQPKQLPYFKFIHGASSMKQAFERGKCYLSNVQ